MVRCWSCSEPRDDSDLFCKQCGASADHTSAPVVEPEEDAPDPAPIDQGEINEEGEDNG